MKVFHPHLAQDDTAFERFRREAEIGARTRHPHIVRTFELGQQEVDGESWHYLVMEYVEGQDLAGLLSDLGTVPESLRLHIADQVLDALAAIHAQGVVHRDVKPENVVITPDDRVLLMDLGIARLLEAGQTLTGSEEFVGSVAYAAPEQFRGGDAAIGPPADIYACGVLLYELTTGRNPFDRESLVTILQQKLTSELPAPRLRHADVDPFWDAVIGTATRKEVAERFASAEEMRRVLREGEAGAWWRERAESKGRPRLDRALRRLQLVREATLVGPGRGLGTAARHLEEEQREGRKPAPGRAERRRQVTPGLRVPGAGRGGRDGRRRRRAVPRRGGRKLPGVSRRPGGPADPAGDRARASQAHPRGASRNPPGRDAGRRSRAGGLPAGRIPARSGGRALQGRGPRRLHAHAPAPRARAAPDPRARGSPAGRQRRRRPASLRDAGRCRPSPVRDRGVRGRRGGRGPPLPRTRGGAAAGSRGAVPPGPAACRRGRGGGIRRSGAPRAPRRNPAPPGIPATGTGGDVRGQRPVRRSRVGVFPDLAAGITSGFLLLGISRDGAAFESPIGSMDADDPEGIRGGTFSSGDLVIVGGGVARGNERRVWLALR